MSGLVILIVSAVILLAAYLIYGRWLAKKWGIDPNAKTPAQELEDGVDYVPAKAGVVFGHQFASIAGAGPINGPIIAAMFGWVPVLLWVLIGGIFFGAVQDFASLYASVKNKGRTIGILIEQYLGKTGKRLFLLFVWLFSILVVAAFADIVAGTFQGFGEGGVKIAANASVATTSLLFIAAAVGLGFLFKYKKPGGLASAACAIVLLVACVALGLAFPIYFPKNFWMYFVFAYIMVASVTPVWALLQPRDYLNSFLLIFMMLAAFLGVIVANPTVQLPAFSGFDVNGNYMFPVLFVTVACGAVSGFHSLVASGTTSKQISNEKHMLPIAFGGMLMESLLAVLALIAVGALAVGGQMPSGTPAMIFAQAIASFLEKLGLPASATYTLITLAISAFALTSLDSVARVGRLSFQELFESGKEEKSSIEKVLTNKYTATVITLIMAYLLSVGGYQNIWPLFGSANQLLAALALLACALFLKNTNRQGKMLYLPMFCMMGITFTALGMTIYKLTAKLAGGSFSFSSDGLQMIFAVLLLALGVVVAVQGVHKLFGKKGVQAEEAEIAQK